MAAPKGSINVNSASLVGLKVELARAQQKYQQDLLNPTDVIHEASNSCSNHVL